MVRNRAKGKKKVATKSKKKTTTAKKSSRAKAAKRSAPKAVETQPMDSTRAMDLLRSWSPARYTR